MEIVLAILLGILALLLAWWAAGRAVTPEGQAELQRFEDAKAELAKAIRRVFHSGD